MSFRRTSALLMRPTTTLLEASWRDRMTFSRYLSISTRYLHKGMTDKEQARLIKFSEPGFEALRAVPGGANEKVEKVPSTYEKM